MHIPILHLFRSFVPFFMLIFCKHLTQTQEHADILIDTGRFFSREYYNKNRTITHKKKGTQQAGTLPII